MYAQQDLKYIKNLAVNETYMCELFVWRKCVRINNFSSTNKPKQLKKTAAKVTNVQEVKLGWLAVTLQLKKLLYCCKYCEG